MGGNNRHPQSSLSFCLLAVRSDNQPIMFMQAYRPMILSAAGVSAHGAVRQTLSAS